MEGTSSYGRGISTALADAHIKVVEVNRTRPAERRRQGKSDRLDAYRAARSVLSGEASTPPKDGSLEPLRALMVARRSALKAQQAAWRQIGALLINAPARIRDLTTEIAEVTERIGTRVAAANPVLLALKGVGPVIGAQLLLTAGDNPERLRSGASFAALCGTAPVPVSSGRTDRHRLSRGGDRAANSALHLIVNNRMSNDARTRTYRDTHLAQNWTKKDVYRSLKRAVAREVYQALVGRCTVPDYSDLRPARHAKNLTLAAAATDLHVWPTAISQIERGKRRDDQLPQSYREWLNAA